MKWDEQGRKVRLTISRPGPELKELTADPDAYVAKNARYIKRDSTTDVAVVDVDGRKMVVKRYHPRPGLRRLKKLLGRDRARRAWSNACFLTRHGVRTAFPLGMITTPQASWYFSEYVDGVRCREYFRDQQVPDDERASVADRIRELFTRLRRHRVSHGDMKDTNVILCDGEPVVIDLDAMRVHWRWSFFRRAHARDLRRFLANFHHDGATAALFRARLLPKK